MLASASPRRRELLASLVSDFQVDPADIDEDALTSPDPWKTARDLARVKATVVLERHPDALVIAADTVVAIETANGYRQLAKPSDAEDAKRMLRELSGRTHQVITGVAIVFANNTFDLLETTHVSFRELGEDEIDAYVATGEPLDKAGAYGIQGGAKEFATVIDGSLSTVIGLPLEALTNALKSVALTSARPGTAYS